MADSWELQGIDYCKTAYFYGQLDEIQQTKGKENMRLIFQQITFLFLATLIFGSNSLQAQEEKAAEAAEGKKIVFLAGAKSHGYAAHEHYAGCVLLAKSLEAALPGYETVVYKYDWPEDESAFDDVDCIVSYSDGGKRHPFSNRLEQVDALAQRGVGIVCVHYAVEITKGEGGDKFVEWLGGYFETDWSVNPHWKANFTEMPEHPITRGVEPFEIEDEWYYHMRFRDQMEGVTPILSAIPPASTLQRKDGAHSNNPHVRAKAGQIQHVAWAAERTDGGGRGFGFTGGHWHWNWGDDNFRKVMLNAIVWTANGEVPEGGIADEPKDLETLKENQDFDEPDNYDWERMRPAKRAKKRRKPADGAKAEKPAKAAN